MNVSTKKTPSTQTPFWLSDPSIFFTDGNFYRIIPTGQMNTVEILNCLSLLLIYMIIALLLFSCTKLVFFPLVGLILIALYYYSFYRNKEKFQSVVPLPLNKASTGSMIYSERMSQAGLSERMSQVGLTERDSPVVISDRQAFTDYVYRLTPTCKEDPASCGVYSDIRYSRENLVY